MGEVKRLNQATKALRKAYLEHLWEWTPWRRNRDSRTKRWIKKLTRKARRRQDSAELEGLTS